MLGFLETRSHSRTCSSVRRVDNVGATDDILLVKTVIYSFKDTELTKHALGIKIEAQELTVSLKRILCCQTAHVRHRFGLIEKVAEILCMTSIDINFILPLRFRPHGS